MLGDLAPTALTAPDSCAFQDCDQSCGLLDLYADSWKLLDGTEYTYAIIDDSTVDGQASRGPQAIVVGDLNGDLRDDLITGNLKDHSVTVLLSHARPDAFRQGEAITHSLPDTPSALALADLDLDGKTDLIVASSAGNSLYVLPNIGGSRVFGPPMKLRTVHAPSELLALDLDQNGQADLVVAQAADIALLLWLNPLQAAWPEPSQTIVLPGPATPLAMTSGQLNGDEIPDLAVSVQSDKGYRIQILLGQSAGRFELSEATALRGKLGTNSEPTSLAIADFDRDGVGDLAVTAYGDPALLLFSGQAAHPGRQFSAPLSIGVGVGAASILAAGVNGNYGSPSIGWGVATCRRSNHGHRSRSDRSDRSDRSEA